MVTLRDLLQRGVLDLQGRNVWTAALWREPDSEVAESRYQVSAQGDRQLALQFSFAANLLPTELLYNTVVGKNLEIVGIWWGDGGGLGRQVDLELLIV